MIDQKTFSIILPGNIGNTGLTSTDLLAPFKIAGLQCLYLMNEGTIGNPVTTLTDLSGNGYTATARGNGWQQMTQQAYGLQLSPLAVASGAGGALFDTAVPFDTGAFTLIHAKANDTPNPTAGVNYYSEHGQGDAFNASPGNNLSNSALGMIGVSIKGGGTTLTDGGGMIDPPGSYFAGTNGVVLANPVTEGGINIYSERLDPTNLRATVTNQAGVVATTAFASGWTAPTLVGGKLFSFGFGPLNATASDASTIGAGGVCGNVQGRLSLLARFSRAVSDAEQAAMLASAQILLQKRGISI